jgi:ribonuclease HI
MIDFSNLLALSHHAERVAGRRLATRTGLAPELALQQVLEQVAGAAGLAALLSARELAMAADTARKLARVQHKAEAEQLRRERHAGPATAWRGWFDGSAHPNPGRCGIGALLKGPDGVRIEVSRPAGFGNSSEAEYQALIALLQAALDAGAHQLTIYGDSRVVIDDVQSSGAAAAASLRDHRETARALIHRLPGVALRWIPRQRNGEADALAQRAAAPLCERASDTLR